MAQRKIELRFKGGESITTNAVEDKKALRVINDLHRAWAAQGGLFRRRAPFSFYMDDPDEPNFLINLDELAWVRAVVLESEEAA